MAERRMITDDISRSAKVAKLSPKAFSLFCLLIPHFNNHGKMIAHPAAIKGICCPLVDWLPLEEIEPLLLEISTNTNVKFFRHSDGLHYLHALSWSNHQKLRTDRLGADRLPSYPGVREHSGSTPGPLLPEVEVEVEVEVESEIEEEEEEEGGSVKGGTDLSNSDTIPLDILEAQKRLQEKRKALGKG